MASRFGRNQRRKLREQIAQLEQAKGDLETQIQCVRVNHRTMVKQVARWDEQLRRDLGNNSKFRVFIETRKGSAGHNGRFQMAAIPQLQVSCGPESLPMDAIIQLEYINMAVAFLRMHKDEFRDSVHFILQHGEHSVGYACNVNEIEDNRRNPHYMEWLTAEIARDLSEFQS